MPLESFHVLPPIRRAYMATLEVAPVICCRKLESDFFFVSLLKKYPETRFLFVILMSERMGHSETIFGFLPIEHKLGGYTLALSMVLIW